MVPVTADPRRIELASGERSPPGSPGDVDRAKAYKVNAVIAQLVAQAIERIITVNGISSFADSHPLQQMQRDTEIVRRHIRVAAVLGKEHRLTLLNEPGVILIA